MPTVESLLREISQLSAEDQDRLRELLEIRSWGDPPGARSEEEWIEEVQRRRALSQDSVDAETALARMFGRQSL